MNRFFSGSLVIVFIVNMTGSMAIIGYHRYHMKHFIETIIKREQYSGQFIELQFSAEEAAHLQWFEEGREFKFEGDMYDIVRTEKYANDTITFHCIKDEKESDLYKEIEKDLSQSSPLQNESKTALRLLNFLSTLYFESPGDIVTPQFDFQKHTSTYLFHYISTQQEPPFIPPRTV